MDSLTLLGLTTTQINLDDPTINAIKTRIRELYKESDCSKFDRDSTLIVDEILRVYGNLKRLENLLR